MSKCHIVGNQISRLIYRYGSLIHGFCACERCFYHFSFCMYMSDSHFLLSAQAGIHLYKLTYTGWYPYNHVYFRKQHGVAQELLEETYHWLQRQNMIH